MYFHSKCSEQVNTCICAYICNGIEPTVLLDFKRESKKKILSYKHMPGPYLCMGNMKLSKWQLSSVSHTAPLPDVLAIPNNSYNISDQKAGSTT